MSDALRERALIVDALRLLALTERHDGAVALLYAANTIEAGHYLGACPTPGSPGVPSAVSLSVDPATGAAQSAGEVAHPATSSPPARPAAESSGGGSAAQRVAHLLEPQPDPVGGRESVTDWLLHRLAGDDSRASALVADLLRARREQGVQRYGVKLRANNGRSARRDALQEAVDLLLYLAQEQMEDPTEPGTARVRLGVAVQLVIELARDIWLEPRPGEEQPEVAIRRQREEG